MKTIKIYIAPYREKVHKNRLNSQMQPFISMEYVTVPSKKNQQQAIASKSTGNSFIKQSDQYIKWKKMVAPVFQKEADKIFERTCVSKITRAKVKIIFYFPNTVPRDLTNKSESIMDALVDSRIIYDDMFQVANKVHLEGYISRDRPRTEIYIHILEPDDPEYEIDRTNYDRFKRMKSEQLKAARDWCKT